MMVEKETTVSAGQWDYILLLTTLLLVGGGVVMVLSASSFLAEKRFNDAYFFFKPQLVFMLVGLALMLILKNIPYQFVCRLSYLWLFIAIVGLILVFVPGVGHKVGGSSRWLHLGFISGQPSEFAKFALVTVLASSLAAKRNVIKSFAYGLAPHLIILGILAGLIVIEPDLGTCVILVVITVVMLFVAGVRISYLLSLLGLSIPVLAVLILRHGYQLRRIIAYLAPWDDPLGAGYHIIHSFYAFALGGLTGVGPGAGRQKLFFLPEPHTDFIFSVVGEELGFIGVALISFLFLCLVWRGIVVALNAYELEGTYLALGLTLIIGVQAFLNMFVVTGLLPTKGLALPFFSYGGSSLIMNFICVGIIMNVASQSKR
ncbi:MAG: putative lipid II flippase FtsW [Deltaproteobacteria bacterium]|nr:putative lipid II flippase FtsW [Deltaproteobacteria bacterium]